MHAAGASRAPEETTGDAANQAYTCPVHLSVTAGEPGRCPICGMELIRREGASDE